MRKKKELQYDSWNIYVMYNDDDTKIDFINNVNSKRLICFMFDPNSLMSEARATEIMNSYESEMLNEAKNIVKENNSFYKNFTIEYRFTGGGFSLFRVANKTYVSRMEKTLNISIIEQ